ncbi:MAG TPA: mechanosensitive ion channel family protein [Candidatus Acidoferrales bacterium]|nr:mechanosensitive ion channel family protein [Candidatus Acidoferrales bacterium]
MHLWGINWVHYFWAAGVIGGAIVFGLIIHAILFFILRRVARRKGDVIANSLVHHANVPARWILPLLVVLAVLPEAPLSKNVMDILEHAAGLGLIAAIAWLVILVSQVTSDILAQRYRVDATNNLLARRVQTQFSIFHRIIVVVVCIVALAIMLMTFPAIKHIGMSILASAGLAGLIVGLAMKDTLSNLVAGIQIAFAQPFRLEDVVIVEGEWGWIEEITTMYVVVRIWDLRRLVLPLSYFLTHPFQNWTRTSAQLLGYIYLNVDYKVPIDEVRKELRRICESTKLWQGKVCVLQATDSTEHTMQIRALMDAEDSSKAWDLRCLVREKLIEFLQKNYPDSLPRYRAELTPLPDGKQTTSDDSGSAGDSGGARAPVSQSSTSVHGVAKPAK